jgi:hypothetical protein
MGWGGHVLDMINRQKANEALKRRKWERHERIRKASSDSTHSDINLGKLTEKKLSEQELIAFKEDLKKSKRLQTRKMAIALLVSLIIMAFLIYLFMRRYKIQYLTL